MDKPRPTGEKSVTVNRKAFHDFHILQVLEAGIALTGSEIKSIREGRVSIREAYVRPLGAELWLVGAHIAAYPPAGRMNHDPTRDRKLLVRRRELWELIKAQQAEGVTIVPLRLYLKRGLAKLEIAIAKGKKRYDKRAAIARREAQRRMQQALRRTV